MLFDLRGRRRRAVQGTYLMLAVLMGGGLVLFGVGEQRVRRPARRVQRRRRLERRQRAPEDASTSRRSGSRSSRATRCCSRAWCATTTRGDEPASERHELPAGREGGPAQGGLVLAALRGRRRQAEPGARGVRAPDLRRGRARTSRRRPRRPRRSSRRRANDTPSYLRLVSVRHAGRGHAHGGSGRAEGDRPGSEGTTEARQEAGRGTEEGRTAAATERLTYALTPNWPSRDTDKAGRTL